MDAAYALLQLCSQPDITTETDSTFMEIEVDTDTSINVMKQASNMEAEQNNTLQLQMDNYKLRQITSTNSLELKSFDDEKVKYYTGLPNRNVLDVLLEYIKTNLSEVKTLSRSHQVLLTLMRMRPNLHNQGVVNSSPGPSLMRFLFSTFLFQHYQLNNKLLRSKYINISIYKQCILYLPTFTSSIIVHLPCWRIHPSIMYMYIVVSSTYLVFEKSTFQTHLFFVRKFGRQTSSRGSSLAH